MGSTIHLLELAHPVPLNILGRLQDLQEEFLSF
jgi:hypothetical protein